MDLAHSEPQQQQHGEGKDFPADHHRNENQLSQYEILEQIGEGEYARVFRARRRSDDEIVALKNIRVFDMNTSDRKDCEREARLLRTVQQHPNLIECYDIFVERNELFIVLEYADGGDLGKLIADMRLNQSKIHEVDIWRVVSFVSGALAHMHGQRVMHRDIKPANIYLTEKGHVKLGDLGLGKVIGSYANYVNSLVGTPYYMSPELVMGESYNVKSDVWSLGCTIYELATLSLPFSVHENNLFALGQKILSVDYEPIVEPMYSPAVQELVARCLVKKPSDRIDALSIHQFATQQLALHEEQFDHPDGSSSSSSSSSSVAQQPLQHSESTSSSSTSNVGFLSSLTSSVEEQHNSFLQHAEEAKHLSSSRASQQQQQPLLSSDGKNISGGFDFRGLDGMQGDPWEHFEDIGVLMSSKYSTVHKARIRATGQLIALKRVQIFDMDSEGRNQCVNEAKILQALPDHPHIITFIASFIHGNDLFEVLELADSGDISLLIQEARQAEQYLDEPTIWRYFLQIASALKHMHDHRIMHRDLKPANVFLTTKRTTVKLGDFGLGRYMSSRTYEAFSQVGTPFYMSPEAIANTGYDFKSDIWSLGCILYELCALQSPFYSKNNNFYTLGMNIRNGVYQAIPDGYSPTMTNVIQSILQTAPEDRPDIDALLEIGWNMVEQEENNTQ